MVLRLSRSFYRLELMQLLSMQLLESQFGILCLPSMQSSIMAVSLFNDIPQESCIRLWRICRWPNPISAADAF